MAGRFLRFLACFWRWLFVHAPPRAAGQQEMKTETAARNEAVQRLTAELDRLDWAIRRKEGPAR